MTSNVTKRLAIVWFRNDLRVGDNLALHKCMDLVAKKQIDLVLPFYCFDRDIIEGVSRELKISRCSAYRRNFIIESVQNLNANLQTRLGCRLAIAYGQPEVELATLVDKLTNANTQLLRIDHVLASREVAHEEVRITKFLSLNIRY